MNENEMSQQERDAAAVEALKCAVFEWNADNRVNYIKEYLPNLQDEMGDSVEAALREIDRLRAKAAAYDTLRAACDGVPEMLDWAAVFFEGQHRHTMRAKAQAIRDALTDGARATVTRETKGRAK